MSNKPNGIIIQITDIYEHKKKKEEELEYYQRELEKLQLKLGMIHQEIGVTETIIKMIENEAVVDLSDQIRQKKKGIILCTHYIW